MKTPTQAMPCPRCGRPHPVGQYGPRPDLKMEGTDGTPYAPPDVRCDCGALLRHTVPIFAVDPYGWHWRIL
jgi:hypothetical protein